MKKRWQVAVIGRGWNYRDVAHQKFHTKMGAKRFAHHMRLLDGKIGIVRGWPVLTYSVEKIQGHLVDPWIPDE